jgi:hypothetical protein
MEGRHDKANIIINPWPILMENSSNRGRVGINDGEKATSERGYEGRCCGDGGWQFPMNVLMLAQQGIGIH